MAVHADSVAVVQQARVFCAKLGASLQVWDYPREPERVPGYFKTAMADTTDIEA